MCFGKPVVAYEVGGAAEIVEDGVNGLLAPAGAPDELADAHRPTRRGRRAARRVGRNARKTYETSYTTDLMIDRLETYYRRIVARPLGAREARTTRGVDGACRRLGCGL